MCVWGGGESDRRVFCAQTLLSGANDFFDIAAAYTIFCWALQSVQGILRGVIKCGAIGQGQGAFGRWCRGFGCISMQFWDFFNISFFTNILTLKSFRNY